MKTQKLKLKDLKVCSFVTEAKRAEKLLGGIYCPPNSWDDTWCPTTEPHVEGCTSTGNGDDPTGMFSRFQIEC
ncbi:MAG: pinensin family lanthipeptide [Cyclobacteriaceae bacterium]